MELGRGAVNALVEATSRRRMIGADYGTYSHLKDNNFWLLVSGGAVHVAVSDGWLDVHTHTHVGMGKRRYCNHVGDALSLPSTFHTVKIWHCDPHRLQRPAGARPQRSHATITARVCVCVCVFGRRNKSVGCLVNARGELCTRR